MPLMNGPIAFISNNADDIEFYLAKRESGEMFMLDGQPFVVELVAHNLDVAHDVPGALVSIRAVAG